VRLWKYLSARAIALDLTAAGYPVSPDVVQRWKKAGKPDPRAADKLAELLGLDTKKEAPRPEWVEELVARLDAIYERQDTIMKQQVSEPSTALLEAWAHRIGGRLGALPSQSDEASADQPGGSAPGIGAR
jgi:hypothetical protein